MIYALARNLPLTLVNHPDAPHAFDLEHDSATTREIVRRVLAFLTSYPDRMRQLIFTASLLLTTFTYCFHCKTCDM